jgi:hypothetical protein
MDAFHLCLALGPVAMYLLLLGMINLSRRPLLVSGTRDAATLGLALSGLVIVGPLTLLFPATTAARLGPFGTHWVWVLMLALYGLCLVLVLLMLRPRLVIYNVTADQLRPILAELVERLDPEARWAGDSLVLPAFGVQLHMECVPWTRNVSLVSAGTNQDYAGWRRLEAELTLALRQTDGARSPLAAMLLSVGAMIVLVLAWDVSRDPQAVARTLYDLLAACWDMVRQHH